MKKTTKFVYNFKEGNKNMKDLLGGKGANLADMTCLGLPIPQGFTVTTQACGDYYKNSRKISKEIREEILAHLAKIEKETGKKLGGKNPLLVSVRSGAKFSMPGMMDTVLNLGLNDETVENLAKLSNNRRFAMDSYRRFIQMFSDVVLEIEKHLFEGALANYKAQKGYKGDLDMTADDFEALIKTYKSIVKKESGKEFPKNPLDQLFLAIEAVFRSWDNHRAIVYRRLNKIPHDIYTAVNVQSMVFGNLGDTSGTGVLFTRNPSTGEKYVYGEYLINAQGEDVVAGIRTPQKLDTLKDVLPKTHKELMTIVAKLEKHYKDMQDVEFTIENGVLFILQTRNGKRTAKAMVKIAVDMFGEKLITKRDAMLRIDASSIDQLLHPMFDTNEVKSKTVLVAGLPASPGAVSGAIHFNAEDCMKKAELGIATLLVREETSPEDIEGMIASKGIITSTGGSTSHAAVVARGMGKPCIVGCSSMHINEKAKTITVNGKTFKEGTVLSMDGATGKIYEGTMKTQKAEMFKEFDTLLKWSDQIRTLKVKANADNGHDAAVALGFGAEGIGLTRTEHMFFEADRIPIVREMILAETKEERVKALNKLYKFQLKDFKEIFRATKNLKTTIRLLDPPLHEFLPRTDAEIEPVAKATGKTVKELREIIATMEESNPMLGHRGCRLAVTYPEIYNMQARAICSAALAVSKELGIKVVPQIKIPLVAGMKEYKFVKDEIENELKDLQAKEGKIRYEIGIMIEVPRAALVAGELAEEADFLSYGTNDLTQMTYGFSRDDSTKFINSYLDNKIMTESPFTTVDKRGVGKLIEFSNQMAKLSNRKIVTGVCGEHGGDPKSIIFFQKAGLDYVSCSPYRVPIARIAAAQAELINEQ